MIKLAAAFDDVFGTVSPPPQVQSILNHGNGSAGDALTFFLSQVIQLLYMVAGLVFVFMILLGAFQWVASGGDKDKIQSAQKRIQHAIIGIILLALAFVFLRVTGSFLGFHFFSTPPDSSSQTVHGLLGP